MIDYDDNTHIYSYRGRRYLSATQLIGYFSQEFDVDEQAPRFSQNHGIDEEEVRRRWQSAGEQARQRGNRIHGIREQIALARGSDLYSGRPFRVRNVNQYRDVRSLQHLPEGIYPELIVWRHDFGIAGRADKIILENTPQGRIAHIDDYKTNKFIRMRSFNHRLHGRQMMKAPLEHIEDCDWMHYQLQLSLYQYMLEYHSLYPGRRQLIHFPPVPPEAPPDAREPAPVIHICSYLRNDVISMLNWLKHRRVL